PEATYLCCRGSTGADLLAAAHATESGGAVGVRIDLQALTDVILATDSGQALRDAGFEIALFGADETLEFEQRYGDDVRLVTTASNFVYRLNLGIYSRDQPFVFEHYRNRNALFVGGIGLLAATIGLGLWVVIRETTRELETARLRAEFVANVSHELRTPLTTIRMYAETLLLDRVSSDEERHEYLRTVMREAQRLSRMVGNILDFSRLESGRKDFDPIELDLGQVVRDTLDEFEPVFDEQHFEVAVDVDNDLPVIHADREALATAVANLVGNAVKYSSAEREIDIRVYAVKAEVCVDISDRGIGIPETERVVVFDKYRRASNVAGRATGTGLGLALVAGIVTSHRGSVEVLARDGGGTTVSMKFPIHKKLT
ncbi:MAG: hypothetical protein HOB49_12595, partial [Gemmatimonadetes bacterium]|nr:hypothetical protein [Gemmatimonadota bacterium]